MQSKWPGQFSGHTVGTSCEHTSPKTPRISLTELRHASCCKLALYDDASSSDVLTCDSSLSSVVKKPARSRSKSRCASCASVHLAAGSCMSESTSWLSVSCTLSGPSSACTQPENDRIQPLLQQESEHQTHSERFMPHWLMTLQCERNDVDLHGE